MARAMKGFKIILLIGIITVIMGNWLTHSRNYWPNFEIVVNKEALYNDSLSGNVNSTLDVMSQSGQNKDEGRVVDDINILQSRRSSSIYNQNESVSNGLDANTTRRPLQTPKNGDDHSKFVLSTKEQHTRRFKTDSAYAIGCNGENTHDSNTIQILVWGRHVLNGADKCRLANGDACQFVVSKSNLTSSDVVMLDAFETIRGLNIFENRSTHQMFIYHQHEAPFFAWTGYRLGHANVFNLTSTYTFDSDVPFWTQEEVVLHTNKTKQSELENEGINYAENKTKMVAWFVSHCGTQSRRETYAKELSNYIPVDIMGSCGNKSIGCGGRMRYEDCDSVFLSKYYKFYLSFENSICQDYVTEKLWRIIANEEANVIPIVLGGANYSALLPAKTYIDVKDFESPEKLAKYLLELHKSDNMFNEYIRNKKAILPKRVPFEFGSKSTTYASRLCQYLHKLRGKVSKIGRSGKVKEYWNAQKMCMDLSDIVKIPEKKPTA